MLADLTIDKSEYATIWQDPLVTNDEALTIPKKLKDS